MPLAFSGVASLLMMCIGLVAAANASAAESDSKHTSESVTIETAAGEQWWLGVISRGHLMPLETPLSIDIVGDNHGNQVQPLLLSSHGRLVWSSAGFQLDWDGQRIKLKSPGCAIEQRKAGGTLKEAFSEASRRYFPPNGELPHENLFSRPQYNTWIELMYDQNQTDILAYAHAIVDNGFPPGVLMIDDNWQENYGKWEFHPGRFSDPKAMVDELHRLGFKVMLWVCPFVSPDSDVYRDLEEQGAFIRESAGRADDGLPKIVRWWNGASAVLDLSNPVDQAWFQGRLDNLQSKYGIDGFKFDAGDSQYYQDARNVGGVPPNEQCRLFAKIGLKYPLNEYRATWQMGGLPLAQRLRDKGHNWKDIEKLVPQMCLLGLMGYPFCCPDMIGGGEFQSFKNAETVDQELIVRSAQCHALMPMMQFSVAPWRVLDEDHLAAVKKAVALRSKFTPYLLATAKESAKSGEPILRPLEYEFPRRGYERVSDHFLIGADLLVVPVVKVGRREQEVRIPPGRWNSFSGDEIEGPKTITVQVKLDEVPYFQRVMDVQRVSDLN